MSWLSKYLGGQQGDQAPTGAETVERLCDRVQSSTLLDDRRDAVRALKSLSKKFRLEVGTQAMTILLGVLQSDRNDTEIMRFALETLCNVMCSDPLEDDEDLLLKNNLTIDPVELGNRFTETFIQSSENISLLLSLLDEYDFYVRWPTVRLLTIVLSNRTREIQDVILANPMGVSKLMDLLSDSRDVIRNDGMLLLTQLTKGNTNIQKIVAFENAFERLLDIIAEEGSSDGGVVVEDSLVLLLNLLKNNISNQTFFKEGSFIKRLTPFFELEEDEGAAESGWSAQKVTNIHLMLQLVRALVSPSNPQQQTAACQRALQQCGVLERLCGILMESGVPADVLTETINTVSEMIRGNHVNQEYFAGVLAPSSPPRPAIVVLLMSMVNDKQPLVLRCAVLYCFQSFLQRNELGQSQIIQTLLPTTAEVNTISAGQLLCGGLFSTDSLSTWFAAVALLHAVSENPAQKEQLLRVQLATSVGNPPVSLLQQCTNLVAAGGGVQTRVGVLMLLCNWLASCPIAVTHFLHNAANVPFLISQISASEGDENELLVQGLCAFLLGLAVLFNSDQVETAHKGALRGVIEKRIGLEMFTDKLSQITKHEGYSAAAKRPHISTHYAGQILFDYEFTRLIKKLENEVLKAVSATELSGAGDKGAPERDDIVTQYKDIIREQDQQLSALRTQMSEAESELTRARQESEALSQQLQQLRDQNALLKVSRTQPAANDDKQREGEPAGDSELQQQIDALRAQLEQREQALAGKVAEDGRAGELEAALKASEAERAALEERLKGATVEATSAQIQLKEAVSGRQRAEDEKKEMGEELEAAKKEQEDLLVLLADQDAKIKLYRKRLKELGETVESDDDDDFDDDLDDDDDEEEEEEKDA